MKRQKFFRLCGCLWLSGLAFATHAVGPVRLVSSLDRTNVPGASGSYLPAFSADGRFVVFTSHARNLVTNDDSSPYLQVYLRDLAASNTVLVSVNTNGL